MKINEHVRANCTEDGLVILDIDRGEIYSGNIVAAHIWKLLIERKDKDEIIDSIVDKYNAPRETVERDYQAFIKSLEEKNLCTF